MYLEAYSRRENINFENIPEEEKNKEDTETVLRTFLETELGFGDAANVEIQRVHPNEDDPTFFKQVFDHLHDFASKEILLGGDFNLVLDVKEDKKGGLPRPIKML